MPCHSLMTCDEASIWAIDGSYLLNCNATASDIMIKRQYKNINIIIFIIITISITSMFSSFDM